MGALQDFHKWRCMRLVHAEVFAQVDRAVWDEVFVKRPDLLQGAASDSARAVCRRRQVFSSRLCSSSADACLRVVWVCCVCQTCTPTTLTRRGCPSPRSRWRTMRRGRAGRRSTTAGWGREPTLPAQRKAIFCSVECRTVVLMAWRVLCCRPHAVSVQGQTE